MFTRKQREEHQREVLISKIEAMERHLRRLRSDKKNLEKTMRIRKYIRTSMENGQRRTYDVSEAQKELSLADIEKMLRKTREEIDAKEKSIKSMEKSLASAKNRLAILKGREGVLKLDSMKKKFGFSSDTELMARMEAILGGDVSQPTNKSETSQPDEPTNGGSQEPSEKVKGKSVTSANDKTKQAKDKEPSADYSKMW